uniref:Uncharacterized protein n=1 Tax=Oryza punctata TaxID=4537 RepID=A0A0E0KQ57_ORYPU
MNLLLPPRSLSLSLPPDQLSHHLNIFPADHTFLSISPILHTTPVPSPSTRHFSSASQLLPLLLLLVLGPRAEKPQQLPICSWGWGFQGWGERRGCVNWPDSHRSELDGCICLVCVSI